jgi:hypothetical protein
MARKTPYTEAELEARRAKVREYNARPEVRERKRAYQQRPEVVAARAAYYQRPEVKQRYIDRRESEAHKAYCKEWRQTETGREAVKAHSLRHSTDGAFDLQLWKTLMALQGGACAICRRPFDPNPRMVHADHCHDTQTPRGLLCQHCNHAEGQIKRTGLSPEEFGRRLSAYLGDPPAARAVAGPIERAQPEERNCNAAR